MTVLIRRKGGNWQRAKKHEFDEEDQLKQLLYGAPDLIVTREDELPAIFMSEVGLPGSGYADLVGVNALGDILIIETKLARNDEIRRKVIGQVLEYGAHLWRMRYEDFNELFKNREGNSIGELFAERSDSITIEEVIQKVQENLELGRFKLLIAVDEINPELEKIIQYVSSFRAGVQLEALEVKIYEQDDTEIFVPQRHGTVPAEPEGGRGGQISIEEILNKAPDEHCRRLYKTLLDEWKKLGYIVKPASAGASFKADIKGVAEPIFWAFVTHISAIMGVLVERGAPADLVASYRSALAQLPGADGKRLISDARPRIDLTKITETEIRLFIDESNKLVQAWRAAP
jgi:hypothetical protein